MRNPTKLEYLKTEFLKKANLCVFHKEPFSQEEEYLAQYQSELSGIRENINQSKTIEEFKQRILEAKEHYMQTIWTDIFDKEGEVKEFCSSFYFQCSFDDVDKFISTHSQLYEDKVKTGFIDKIKTAIADLFKSKPTEDTIKVLPIISFHNLHSRAEEIMNKYNIQSLDLSVYQTDEKVLEFLNKFDKNADEAFSRLGVDPKAFGIKNTLHLKSNTVTEAWYNRGTKVISLALDHMSPSTILHEWVHALDNHICLSHTGINDFVSENQTSQVKDTTNNALSFNILKSLTQKIFNDNFEDVAKIKEQELEKGASKFWSTVLGPRWYGLDQEKRDKLMSSTVMLDINNYISKPSDISKKYILEAMHKVGFTDIGFNNSRLESKQKEIIDVVKPFFDNINKNLISSKSFYYISSYIANLDRRFNRFLEKMEKKLTFNKTQEVGTGNLYADDYYVQPCEMLARYFQGQVFPEIHKASKYLDFCHPYTTKKDEDFELFKNNIVANSLGKDMILSNRDKLRESIIVQTEQRNKP